MAVIGKILSNCFLKAHTKAAPETSKHANMETQTFRCQTIEILPSPPSTAHKKGRVSRGYSIHIQKRYGIILTYP